MKTIFVDNDTLTEDEVEELCETDNDVFDIDGKILESEILRDDNGKIE